MFNIENRSYLGNWNFKIESPVEGSLNIQKTGEIYRCLWKIERENTKHEYLGIGMIVNNQLLVSRFLMQTPRGGIGLYKPIGDSRSNSALWASTQSFNTLGSGIALRKDSGSDKFEGSYIVRYFLNGDEIAMFNLEITELNQNGLYTLTWAQENNVESHGIGMINNREMAFAWGDPNIDYELIILDSVDDEERKMLKGKCALLSNGNVMEEIYIKD